MAVTGPMTDRHPVKLPILVGRHWGQLLGKCRAALTAAHRMDGERTAVGAARIRGWIPRESSPRATTGFMGSMRTGALSITVGPGTAESTRLSKPVFGCQAAPSTS